MKKLIILVVILNLIFTSSAQNQNYVITNKSDTLYGKIQGNIKPGTGKIKFLGEDGRKKRFYPRQIKGFVLNDSVRFVSILQTENAEAAEYHIFALVVAEGPLILLSTQNKTGFLFSSKNDKQENNYYLQDIENGDIVKLPRLNYRRLLADRVSNYGDLKREVLNKVYSYEEIPVVIEKYNNWLSKEIN